MHARSRERGEGRKRGRGEGGRTRCGSRGRPCRGSPGCSGTAAPATCPQGPWCAPDTPSASPPLHTPPTCHITSPTPSRPRAVRESGGGAVRESRRTRAVFGAAFAAVCVRERGRVCACVCVPVRESVRGRVFERRRSGRPGQKESLGQRWQRCGSSPRQPFSHAHRLLPSSEVLCTGHLATLPSHTPPVSPHTATPCRPRPPPHRKSKQEEDRRRTGGGEEGDRRRRGGEKRRGGGGE
eukprot:2924843-Rhodomonas_salina.1